MSVDIKTKYEQALQRVEKEGIVAVLLKQEEYNDITVKWRLTLRKGKGDRPFHTLEIVDPESGVCIQIPLMGNWTKVLNVVDQILTNLDMNTFAEIKKQLLSLTNQPKSKSSKIEEI